MTPINPSAMPALCKTGAQPDLYALFDQLRKHWLALNPGKSYTNLAELLGVPKQRVTQYATGSGETGPAPWHVFMQICHILGYVIVFAPDGVQIFKKPSVVEMVSAEVGPTQPEPAASTDPAADARARELAKAQYEGPFEDDVAIHADAPVNRTETDVWVQAWLRVNDVPAPAGAEAKHQAGGEGAGDPSRA